MNREEQVLFCKQLFSEEYGLDKETADAIISDLELEDKIIDRYDDELSEKEQEIEDGEDDDLKGFNIHKNVVVKGKIL